MKQTDVALSPGLESGLLGVGRQEFGAVGQDQWKRVGGGCA